MSSIEDMDIEEISQYLKRTTSLINAVQEVSENMGDNLQQVTNIISQLADQLEKISTQHGDDLK